MDGWQITFALLAGFSLAATCGLRAFLPLLIICLGARADFLTLAGGFEWMESWPAIVCFGSATIIEILADKIPAVDHVLDAAGVFVRPVAGAVAASSLISGIDPMLALVIGIIMGGTIALIVQSIKGALRVVSSGLTGGLGNPAISTAEDGAAAVAGVASFFVPWLTALVILGIIIYALRPAIRKLRGRTPVSTETQSVQVE